MIEFKGELSTTCRAYVLKNETKIARLSSIIVCLPLSIINVALAISNGLFYLIFMPVFLLTIWLAGLQPKEKSYGLIMTEKVIITEDNMRCVGERFSETRLITQVKQVIDYGEWYKITFYFPNKSQRFICQKNLITQGSIEEFENLFEGLIIKRKFKYKSKDKK